MVKVLKRQVFRSPSREYDTYEKEARESNSTPTSSTDEASSEQFNSSGMNGGSSHASISSLRSIATGGFNEHLGVVCFDKIPEEVVTVQTATTMPEPPSSTPSSSLSLQSITSNNTTPAAPQAPSPYPFLTGSFYISAEGLSLRDVMAEKEVRGRAMPSHEGYYDTADNVAFLESGGAMFTFTCKTSMTNYEAKMLDKMVNLSGFRDETRENHVPHFDVASVEQHQKYTFMIQRAAYLLPGVDLDTLTQEMLSTVEYHQECEPKGTTIWKDCPEPYTFRITKPVIKYIYNLTVQFQVSMINDEATLQMLSELMGVRVDKAALMERTKRNKVNPKPDGTAKAKSVLMWTRVPGGLLVTHATVILNTQIPSVVAKIVHTLAAMGLKEACETAKLTRKYLLGLQKKGSNGYMHQ